MIPDLLKIRKIFIRKKLNQRGNVSLLMALGMFSLVGFSALAIDLGHGWLVKQELQNVADAGALAGAGLLGQIYEGMSVNEQQNYFLTSTDKQAIINQVNSLSPNSYAGGVSINFSAQDILVGVWDSTAKTFTEVPADAPGSQRPTAVSVQVRRDATQNQPLSTYFAGLLGYSGINISSRAIAAMTLISHSAPGGIGAPVGISKAWFTNGGSCGQPIQFQPTGTITGCAGWHTFTDPNTSANNLNTIINGLTDGVYDSPEAIAGQTQFQFTGGTVTSIFNDFETLYNSKKDADGNWTVLVPVYDSVDCGNPSGPILIVGFATATISYVAGAPVKTIGAVVNCDSFESGRGDGDSSGNPTTPLGTIPGLVS